MTTPPITPDDARSVHATAPGADEVRLHYVRRGRGPAVVLLHGWPGFWYDWRRILPELATRADVIAPDFRGFGHSGMPAGPPLETASPEHYARDILALMDHIGVDRAVLAGHDIGAVVAQVLALKAPERFPRLVLIDPPYAGIGRRRFDPEVTPEFWYYNFHNLPWAADLVAYNRDTVRIYLRHFYDHWVGRKDSVKPDEFEAIVDVFARPGAFATSVGFYRARAAQRRTEAGAGKPAPIAQPVRVLWGALDPVIRVAWADRLAEFFTQVTLTVLPDAGHFLPFEAPTEVLAAIDTELAAIVGERR